jgi:hypothetical protein
VSLVTLLIAIVGAVTGIGSLAWQILSWRLDRGRLRELERADRL